MLTTLVFLFCAHDTGENLSVSYGAPKTIHPMRAYTYIALDLTFGVLACCGEVSFSYVAQKTNMPNGCLP